MNLLLILGVLALIVFLGALLACRRPRPVVFIDQPVLERYDDAQKIGTWGYAAPDETGKMIFIEKGELLGRTVKFQSEDGIVRLGTEWLPDNDKQITGFDPDF